MVKDRGFKWAHGMCSIFFMFVVLACDSNDKDNDLGTEALVMTVDEAAFHFPAEGGSDLLNITSNTSWFFSVQSGDWCKPTIQSAQGDVSVTLNAEENESDVSRSMNLTLTAEGVDEIVIEITQSAGESPNVLEPGEEAYIDPDNTDMRNLTSLELSQEMGVGWNLGNSLEAIYANTTPPTGNETSWGNPTVTKQFIDSVKNAGFNTIRVPVSWSHMMSDQELYKIKKEWKERVAEVVNYALDNDMYVIMNIHWDSGWLNEPVYDKQEELNNRLAIMWKQIAVFFRDYDDHLLFAGTNEVLFEGDYSDPTAEYVNVQNSFNQTFVNTVRATGGRNTYRHLVVQTFNTNIAHGVNHFVFPEDETDDRLMVEAHFYDPYQFALQEDGGAYLWGADRAGSDAHSGWGDEDWVDEAFTSAQTAFIDQGYPVILGEYGAILRSNLTGEAKQEHINSRNDYLHYVTKSAIEHGIVPVYWDNGVTDNNGFGLFDRSTGEVVYRDAVNAIISANTN